IVTDFGGSFQWYATLVAYHVPVRRTGTPVRLGTFGSGSGSDTAVPNFMILLQSLSHGYSCKGSVPVRLTGEISTQLGQSSSLVILDLSHNSLIGTIPETFGNASNIRVLLLDHNRLSGEILSSF
ncbi:LRR receptor-like serine/threonine-protein kinase, partial [Nymphaea thermarum]